MSLLALLVLVGCAEPVDSRFAATHEACGFTPRAWNGVEYQYVHVDEVYPDEACVDRVLDDFSVDVDAFLVADDLDDPYGVVRDDDGVWSTRLGGLLSAAWALHAFDWGALDDLAPSEDVDGSFVSRMEEVGGEPLGGVFYDYVTEDLDETVPADGATFTATRGGGTLTLFRPLTGAIGAAVLVHEARHGDGGHAHKACASGERACDRDLEGAYGFEAATIASALEVAEDDVVREHLSAHLAFALAHVQP